MKPEILIVKHDGDDFPVVIEPWGIERTDSHNYVGPMKKSGDGKVREVVITIERKWLKKEVIARNDFHSQLIAAAPELYLALKRVIAVADRSTEEFDAAHAAIKLVEGNI